MAGFSPNTSKEANMMGVPQEKKKRGGGLDRSLRREGTPYEEGREEEEIKKCCSMPIFCWRLENKTAE